MNNTIPTITVGELISRGEADVQTGPFGTQLKASEYVDFGIPVINVRNVGFGEIRDAELEYVTDAKAEKLKAHQLQKGDIVFGRKGAVERHALIDEEQSGWVQGSDCLRLRLKSPSVCERYASYYLRTRAHQDWMQALCSFGATMASLNQDIVKRITIPLPSLTTQRKIAAILTAYDDLIEINRRRIALLEKIAEELYREWFVRMRFPGHQDTRFVKGVPEGWEVKRIAEIYKTSSGGTPSRKVLEYYNGDIQWLKTGELKSLFTCRSQENITLSGLESSSAKIFPARTVIMAMYCAMPDISIATYDVATNQACCAFLPKNNWLHYGFNYYLLRAAQKELVMFAHGAAQQNLSQDIIGKYQILLPSKSLVEKFGTAIEPMLQMIQQVAESNEVLTKTRDLLLPRLISGKLSVEDLDIQFPPSMREEAA